MWAIALGAIFVLGGGCVVCVGAAGNKTPKVSEHRPIMPEKNTVRTVPLTTLLGDYKDNEIRADGKYKGKTIQVSGTVDDVKKDILGKPYVTVGSGARFEIPQVQCTGKRSGETDFANLQPGTQVTVQGKVEGLMLNVLLDDCEIK